MQEPLDARLELHEPAELRLAHHLAGELAAVGMLRCDALPRVGLERLHRQRNAVTALRQLDDPGGHIVAHLEHFVGVGHPGALELGDVNEPLDAAEIDEGAEVGERNHLAGDRRADGEGGAGFGGLVRLLVTQYRGVRDHEPVTLFLDPEDAKEEALIEVLGRLLGGSQFHRGAWAEGGDAVHHDMETALVPADDLALDIGLIGDRRLDDFARHERELLRRRHDELVDRLAGGTMALLARLAVAPSRPWRARRPSCRVVCPPPWPASRRPEPRPRLWRSPRLPELPERRPRRSRPLPPRPAAPTARRPRKPRRRRPQVGTTRPRRGPARRRMLRA